MIKHGRTWDLQQHSWNSMTAGWCQQGTLATLYSQLLLEGSCPWRGVGECWMVNMETQTSLLWWNTTLQAPLNKMLQFQSRKRQIWERDHPLVHLNGLWGCCQWNQTGVITKLLKRSLIWRCWHPTNWRGRMIIRTNDLNRKPSQSQMKKW